MSEYNSTATTTLYVNGKPAESEIKRLKQDVINYRNELHRIATDKSLGVNSKQWHDVRKKMIDTEKELGKIQSGVANVTQVMHRLDKATPNELKKVLKQLKSELDNIERGSRAWDEHQRKIRAVKEELAKINKEAKVQTSLWDRFAKKMFEWGTAIQTVMATITGITLTARQAVKAYAEIDQEMANVRKYTGMAAEQVAALNDEFLKMDTRTSRAGLNQLAQEAGRLGMQSQEDVMGFVRAADKINVALDELGEGATLTLSKLTDIFGDRQRLGVEKSLLSVGSVINELSQNSTASAAYLAEFASRLGGVGAQAGMTTQQIMGFGAVLDSYNQKVESSSTALSQVIVRLYREPAKYAKVAGLDIQQFTELLKNDANAALIQFLEALNKAGGMDVLSPMFKDMGENGARAITALSTLATHINEVKNQQEVANQAFSEAISIDKEFNVQNNTVQAGLEKAKKHFNEMAITLGEKLAPFMRHTITSGAALMKIISVLVDFFVKYKVAIAIVTAGIVAHTIAVKASTIAFKTQYYWMVLTEAFMGRLKTTLLAIKIVWYGLTLQINKAKAAYVAFHLLTKTTPWGAIITAITTLGTVMYMLYKRTKDAREEQSRLKLESKKAEDAIRQVSAKIGEETSAVKRLTDAINAQNIGSGQRNALIREFNNKFGSYLTNLLNEKSTAQDVAAAYAEVVRHLRAKLLLEAKENDFKEKVGVRYGWEAEKLADFDKITRDNGIPLTGGWLKAAADEAYSKGNQDAKSIQQAVFAEYIKAARKAGMSDFGTGSNNKDAEAQRAMGAYLRQYISTRAHEIALDKKWQPYQDDIDAAIASAMDYGGGGYAPSSGNGSGSGGGSAAKPDKFAAEKVWREREIALNKIAWLKGEQDYESYTNRMLAIETEYHKKRLSHVDLEGNEQVTIMAEFLEAKKKQQEQYDTWSVEEEKKAYEDLKRQAQEDYLQKRISTETYNMELENIEFAHLRAMTYITKEGTEERAKAEKAYRDKLVQDQQQRQAEFEKKEKEHQKKLEDVWDEYAVSQEEKRERLIKETEKLLEEMYKSKLALIEMDESLTPEQKQQAVDKLTEQYKNALKKLHESASELGHSLEDWISKLFDKLFGEGTWGKYGETIKSMFASVTSVFSSLNAMADAENELRMARLEKYYEREISMAEGNAYKVKQIERKKQREEAKLKAEASKRQFAQQVISAVAETALAAINAYASASKVSWILGPIAAAMAVAAGAIQIAAIKKQQAASLAQGFSKGGFTPDGRPDEPVGIVHAGEWVASQKLLKNPQTRAAIEALDYAQRTNTIGRLNAADVSRSVTAPQVIAGAAGDGSMQRTMTAMVAVMGRYGDTMERLGQRLDEPFVTVNTVTGDTGIKQAQDEYQRLQNNTLPKSKRK